jgi:hypothetical protein
MVIELAPAGPGATAKVIGFGVGAVLSTTTENGTAVPELTVVEVLSVTVAERVCDATDNTPRSTVSGDVALVVVETGVELPSR